MVQHSSLSTPPNTDMVAFNSYTACNGSQQKDMLQVQCTLGGEGGPGWAGRTTGAVLTASHTSQRKITALVQGKELNAIQKYYLLVNVGPPNSITLCVSGHHNSGKPTMQCSGSLMTTSSSFPQDPTTTKMGTGFMSSTSTFLRFFHLGRWEAMISPASACEEVGHSSKITTTLQKHSVACKHCSMYTIC